VGGRRREYVVGAVIAIVGMTIGVFAFTALGKALGTAIMIAAMLALGLVARAFLR